jgi:hypothetical protein
MSRAACQLLRKRKFFHRPFPPLFRGPDWMLITPKMGAFVHRRDTSGDRLRGWAYRIRTSMCKVKIHLFELSAMFGFTCTSADRLVAPGE